MGPAIIIAVIVIIAAVIIINNKSADKSNAQITDSGYTETPGESTVPEKKEEQKPSFKKSVESPKSEVTADGKMKSNVLKGGVISDGAEEEAKKDTDNKEITFMDGVTALVVEDEPEAREKILELLSKMNILTDIAENGMKCLQLTTDNKYDMVFISYEMSRMDGVQTLRNILNTENNQSKGADYYIITSKDSTEPEVFFTKEGFKKVLKKPMGKFTIQYAAAVSCADFLVENDAETLNYLKYLYETETTLHEFGMSYEKALNKHNDDLKTLQEEASEFCDSYEDLSSEMMDALYEKKPLEYADKMRSLRKSAENLGMTELYEMADEHVNFAVKDNMDMAEEGWRALELKCEDSVSGLRSWLGKTDKLLNVTQVLAIQTNGVVLSEGELNERLANIKEHIIKGNYKNAEFSLGDICQHEISAESRMKLNEIMTKLQTGEYEAALEIIS